MESGSARTVALLALIEENRVLRERLCHLLQVLMRPREPAAYSERPPS